MHSKNKSGTISSALADINSKDSLLYLHNVDTTWTRRDREILTNQFEVTDKYIKTMKDAFHAANPINIAKYDHVFCWFGSLNFLPCLLVATLLRKEITIVAGGFDVAKVPSINYGGFERKRVSKLIRKLIFSMAHRVLSVSYSNTDETINNAGVDHRKVSMIYHGFTPMVKEITPFDQRRNQILSVGAINPETMKRKGHERFIELAKSLPQFDFVLAGKFAAECKSNIDSLGLKNLKMTGFLNDEELTNLFSESKFYVQLSEHEAFGCSVVEAGICGCNLIVSSKSALPEVVAENGVSFPPNEINDIKHYILDHIEDPGYSPQKISKNLLEKYSFSKRKEALLKAFK